MYTEKFTSRIPFSLPSKGWDAINHILVNNRHSSSMTHFSCHRCPFYAMNIIFFPWISTNLCIVFVRVFKTKYSCHPNLDLLFYFIFMVWFFATDIFLTFVPFRSESLSIHQKKKFHKFFNWKSKIIALNFLCRKWLNRFFDWLAAFRSFNRQQF